MDSDDQSAAGALGQPSAVSFDRLGREWHLRVQRLGDLARVLDLDETLWAATSVPVRSLHADPELLDWLDADHDGRLQPAEIKAAIRWVLDHLEDAQWLQGEAPILPLAGIRKDGPDSARLLDAAQRLLPGHGESGRPEPLRLDAVRQARRQVEVSGVHRAGMVSPEAADSPDLCRYLRDVLDSSPRAAPGKPRASGVTLAALERFHADCDAHLEWLDRGRVPEGASATEIMPLGEDTAEAFALVTRLAPKLDAFFQSCDLLRFQAPEGGPTPSLPGKPAAETWSHHLARAPLAPPNVKGQLALHGQVNPHHETELLRLASSVLTPLLGTNIEILDARQWNHVKSRFAPYTRWLAERPNLSVARLPEERLRRYHAEPDFPLQARKLIETSYHHARRLADLRLLERLLLGRAHLLSLARSVVSFADLYDPDRRALFEMGTLLVAGRAFDFTVRLEASSACLGLCRSRPVALVRAAVLDERGRAAHEVLAPVTRGGWRELHEGQRGLFQDREGREYHARLMEVLKPWDGRGEMPGTFMAWLGQRFRAGPRPGLAGMLEAAGWGVNVRMTLTPGMARQWTRLRQGGGTHRAGFWWMVLGLATLLGGLFLYSAL